MDNKHNQKLLFQTTFIAQQTINQNTILKFRQNYRDFFFLWSVKYLKKIIFANNINTAEQTGLKPFQIYKPFNPDAQSDFSLYRFFLSSV